MFFWAEFNERINFCASEAKTKFKFKIAAKFNEAVIDLKTKKRFANKLIFKGVSKLQMLKKTLFCEEGCW